jgi:hypothetical protein
MASPQASPLSDPRLIHRGLVAVGLARRGNLVDVLEATAAARLLEKGVELVVGSLEVE